MVVGGKFFKEGKRHEHNDGQNARILHCLYKAQGVALFYQNAPRLFFAWNFIYFAKHLSKFHFKYETYESFLQLYKKSFKLSPGSIIRYRFTIFNPEDVLAGPITACANDTGECPIWQRITRIKSTTRTRKLLKDEGEFFSNLIYALKLCGKCVNTLNSNQFLTPYSCQSVTYCSRRCQKQHWKVHKSVCIGDQQY